MYDIRHRVATLTPSPDRAFEALTTLDGLRRWWTDDTSGDAGKGGTLQFRFPNGGFDMAVREVDPASSVRWEVVDGPEEWIGTTIDWDLRQDGDHTIVMFTHGGWREPVEFMHHCSTKWATYLVSLKAMVETGTGRPAPGDLPISDWD